MTRVALLTGATGYIGGRLAVRLLADGWRVHAVVRPSSVGELPLGVEAHRLDGATSGLTAILTDTSPDIVFHLASLYLADHRPDQVDDLVGSNILFGTQLFEAMTAAGVKRVVNTGSASQHYGTTHYNPVSLYAATKQACADIMRYYHEARGLSAITLKLYDTYGAGDTRRKLVQLIADAAMSGERLELSPGEQVIDLVHVDDVVAAFVLAADRLLIADHAIYDEFFLSGERLGVRALVSLVEETLERRIEAVFGARAYREREVMVPVEPGPVDALPGWQPQRRLRQSVSSLVRPE